MAEHSESTPFLADNDHGGREGIHSPEADFNKVLPANAHFRRPIKLLAAITAFLSLSDFILLIASIIMINVGPFQYTWGVREAARDLSICTIVNFILTAPTIFVQIPILINMAIHIAMSIVIFVFSAEIFGDGWPNENMCRRWTQPLYPERPQPIPSTWECREAAKKLRIVMGVSGGIGFAIGLLILIKLLLRLVGLYRTKFWEGGKLKYPRGFGWSSTGNGWHPTGFTVQFTLSILPNERPAAIAQATPAVAAVAVAADPASSAEEGRLIET